VIATLPKNPLTLARNYAQLAETEEKRT